MAARLPVLSGAELAQTFERIGWRVARQRGSHIIMIKNGHRASLSVPDHATVAKGTLRSLIRAFGHSVDEFVDAVK